MKLLLAICLAGSVLAETPGELWQKAATAYEAQRFSQAKAVFASLIIAQPESAAPLAMVGLCEYRMGQFEAALDHLERAHALGLLPTNELGRTTEYHNVILLTRAGRFEEALARTTKYAQHNFEENAWLLAMGLAGLRRPLLPVEVLPADRDLINRTGKVLWLQSNRRNSEIIDGYRELTTHFDHASGLHFLFGSYLLNSDPVQARQELEREIAITPDHVPALVVLAIEYLNDEDALRGLPLAKRATEAAPNDFAAHVAYGRLLAAAGDNLGRVRELEQARALAPGSPEVRFALASAYAQTGKTEQASAERSEFLRLRDLRKEQAPAKP